MAPVSPAGNWRIGKTYWALYLKFSIFILGQFGLLGIVVACMCVCVCLPLCMCVNYGFVHVMTHYLFNLEPPNFGQRMQNTLVKFPIVLEVDSFTFKVKFNVIMPGLSTSVNTQPPK